MPANFLPPDYELHFDALPVELREKLDSAFGAHFSATDNLPPGHFGAVNFSELLAKSKLALAAASAAYASVGIFVPANYDAIIKIALASVTAAVNAIPAN